MKKTRLSTLAVLLIAATAAFAQGPRGTQQHQNTSNHPAAVPDMTKTRTVTGTVSAVDIGYGMQYPSITVNQSVIKVAPVWFLVEQNFELKAGDQVSVVAAPSTVAGDSYLYAIEIANIGGKTRIVLRDAAGVPLWTATTGARGGNAAGAGNCSGCLDLTTVNTAAGTVEKDQHGNRHPDAVAGGKDLRRRTGVDETRPGARVARRRFRTQGRRYGLCEVRSRNVHGRECGTAVDQLRGRHYHPPQQRRNSELELNLHWSDGARARKATSASGRTRPGQREISGIGYIRSVAPYFGGARLVHRQAGRLVGSQAARQRRDVRVTHFREDVRGNCRPPASLAVDDDGSRLSAGAGIRCSPPGRRALRESPPGSCFCPTHCLPGHRPVPGRGLPSEALRVGRHRFRGCESWHLSRGPENKGRCQQA